jgi:predicted ATPase
MRRPAKPDPSRTNVREVASSFVGRATELSDLAARFERGARLVTLIGPGGMGKTRMAARFAQGRVATYAAHGGGGVWVCDLTEARGVAGIVSAVAAALGVRLLESVDETAEIQHLAHAIARRGRVLLVLDNFEHLLAEGRAAVGSWLAVAPHARLLVTSRIALRVDGEELLPLMPLPESDATELFLQRARLLRPDLTGKGKERDDVEAIVRCLEGVPLAIELAASRMAVLSHAQLRERLGRPLDLLAERGAAGRHASMRDTILDSVRMLTGVERDFFAACAIFRDGFTLEAAEFVIGKEGALEQIEALARSSLLRTSTVPELDHEPRFSLFETIREVASELFAEHPERERIADAHTSYYARLAERLGADAALQSGGPAFLRLARELENMRSAHARAVEDTLHAAWDPAGHRGIAIALGLEPLLSSRGLTRLRIRLLGDAIARAKVALPLEAPELVEARLAHGLAMRELGDMEGARDVFEESLDLAVKGDLFELAALAHTRIGEVVDVSGSTREALDRFALALTLLARSGTSDPRRRLHEAETYMGIGHAYRREGELSLAESAVAEALARYRTLGHAEGVAAALYEAAVVAMFQGRRRAALARFDEGLAVARGANARATAGALTTARGSLLQEMGELDEALAAHADAARVFRELGSRYRETSALYYLATAYLERGEPAEAERFLLQALDRARGVGSPRYETLIESCRALALAHTGDIAAASQALARAIRAQAMCATEPALRATLTIHRLSFACRSGAGGASVPSAEARVEARAVCAAHPSDDSRFALRMLLAQTRPAAPLRHERSLLVWEQGRAFRRPGGRSKTDLTRRAALRRVLHLLACRRHEAPGVPVAVEAIVRAGWPGERIQVEAGLNRAYVALATLRKLGLREVLLSGEGGYWLSPAVVLIVVSDEVVPD